jgi:hypothetical protein
MRFTKATYRARQGMLDITFENGDHYVVAAESVLPWMREVLVERTSARGARSTASETLMAWDKMRIGETGDVLEIPADDRVIEIPWDRIRALADVLPQSEQELAFARVSGNTLAEEYP